MSAPVWLLDLVAGQTWRFGTRAVSWDGHAYQDGMDDPGGLELALSFDEPQESSVAVVINAQHEAQLDTEDIALGAMATLYYWHDPDSGDDPIIVVSGTVDDPEYGGRDEPLTFSVRDVPWDDHGLLPPSPAARIDATTWPLASREMDGEWYPIVIGQPGISDDDVMGSPAFYVQTGADQWVLLAGHRVVATTVELRNVTASITSIAPVIHVADGRGATVAVANITGIAAGYTTTDEIWAIWDQHGLGGLPSLSAPTVAMTGAGDVIEYLLHRSTIRVDWGRLRAASARINRYRIDTYIQGDPESRVTPWTWITEHLLSILPVAVRTSPAGLYLAVFDPASPASAAVAEIEEGRNASRVSPVSVLGTADVVNDLSITYSSRADGDKGVGVARLTGSAATAAVTGALRSAVCELSVLRYGGRPMEMATTAVYDPPTATRILLAVAARDALPVREATYEVDDDPELLALEPGDLVALSDSDLGWTDRAAWVWLVRVAEVREITLRLWHSPGRDRRA